MGLTSGSYEAYCLDQAVWYLGTTVTAELDKVGKKPQKGEAANNAARQRSLNKLLGKSEQPGTPQFADPSALFQ